MNIVDELNRVRISIDNVEREVVNIQEELERKYEDDNKYVCKLFVKPNLTEVERFISLEDCENHFLENSKKEDVIGGITYFKGEDKILHSVMFNNDYHFYKRGVFKEFCKAISNNYSLKHFESVNFGNGCVKDYSELMSGLTRVLVFTYSYNCTRDSHMGFEESMGELGEYFDENEDKESLLKDWIVLKNHRAKIEENKMVIKLK